MSRKRKNKEVQVRDWNAVDAHFRNSAGPMKDRRNGRGGSTNISRDLLDDYYDSCDMETHRETSPVDSSDGDSFHFCDGNLRSFDMNGG
jgi:hypothetical protein